MDSYTNTQTNYKRSDGSVKLTEPDRAIPVTYMLPSLSLSSPFHLPTTSIRTFSVPSSTPLFRCCIPVFPRRCFICPPRWLFPIFFFFILFYLIKPIQPLPSALGAKGTQTTAIKRTPGLFNFRLSDESMQNEIHIKSIKIDSGNHILSRLLSKQS